MSLSTSITDGVVTLRPFQMEDAQELYAAVHESLIDVKPWMSWRHDGYSMEEARSFIAITRARWGENTLFAFAITDAKNGSVVGGISLSHLHPVYHLCNVPPSACLLILGLERTGTIFLLLGQGATGGKRGAWVHRPSEAVFR